MTLHLSKVKVPLEKVFEEDLRKAFKIISHRAKIAIIFFHSPLLAHLTSLKLLPSS